MNCRIYISATILVVVTLTMRAEKISQDTTFNKALEEVVVEANMQHTNSSSTTYIPSVKAKNSTADAYSLLSQMAIPQLNIDPINNSIETNSGSAVTVYINYIKANEQDLKGLAPNDVKRVEYLLYPQDPRFKGANFVLNIIVQKYEWGGYTKLSGEQWMSVNKTAPNVYSKFAYKSMIFDLYGGATYSKNKHFGDKKIENLSLLKGDDDDLSIITRTTLPVSSLNKVNSNNVIVRANYSDNIKSFSNTLSFANTVNPQNLRTSLIEYDIQRLYDDYLTSVRKSDRQWNINYSFEGFVDLGTNLSLNIDASYRYLHNKSFSNYVTDGLDIVNDARENSHNVKIAPYLLWSIEKDNSLGILSHFEYNDIKVNYSGDSPSYQNYSIYGGGVGLRYMISKSNWNAGTILWWTYAHTDFSGFKDIEQYPQGTMFFSFSPSDRQQLEMSWGAVKEIPETYQKSPNMLQENEIMWYAGTPSLKSYWRQQIKFSYLWLYSNKLQLSAIGDYYWENDAVTSRYTQFSSRDALLRKYINGENIKNLTFGFSATAKFLKGKLVAKVTPRYRHRSMTGEYSLVSNNLECTAQLTWYFGRFYLYGWYSTSGKNNLTAEGLKFNTPSRYMWQIGWGDKAWRASLSAYNLFQSSWKISDIEFKSPYYRYNEFAYGNTMHRRFQLSISYTIGYGKKIRHGNELENSADSSSAILR